MEELDIQEMYRRYFPIVREKCSRMLNDSTEAQDVAQETFLRLWANRGRLANPDGVASWIYRTSTRLAVDRLRSRARHKASQAADPTRASSSRRALGVAEARDQLTQLAKQVPAKELEVAFLSRVDGMTQEEIARVLGKSDRTIRRMLSRFERRLADLQQREVA